MKPNLLPSPPPPPPPPPPPLAAVQPAYISSGDGNGGSGGVAPTADWPQVGQSACRPTSLRGTTREALCWVKMDDGSWKLEDGGEKRRIKAVGRLDAGLFACLPTCCPDTTTRVKN